MIKKVFLSIIALIFINSCITAGGAVKTPFSFFSFKKGKIHAGDTINVSLNNKENLAIEKSSFFIDDKSISLNGKSYIIPKDIKLGAHKIKGKVQSDGESYTFEKQIEIFSGEKGKLINFEIVNTYPHDIKAYTQGLEYHNGFLYESTGLRGKSSLRKVDIKTGEVLQKIDLDAKYFGEGITIIGNEIIMLTWQSKKGFVFDLNTFELKREFNFNKSKEGWGLCHDGSTIYKSDGTEKIWTLNPETLAEENYISMYTNNKKIKNF